MFLMRYLPKKEKEKEKIDLVGGPKTVPFCSKKGSCSCVKVVSNYLCTTVLFPS